MSEEANALLDAAQQRRWSIKDNDPFFNDLIDTEKERLTDAARTLGREWTGMFNDGHLGVVAYAYHSGKSAEFIALLERAIKQVCPGCARGDRFNMAGGHGLRPDDFQCKATELRVAVANLKGEK